MRMMTERLEKTVEEWNLVADEQQGFRSDRSCYSAITTLKMILNRQKARGEEIQVAYLDISKAYDTVNHKQLWEICQKKGIEGEWLNNLKALYKHNELWGITN